MSQNNNWYSEFIELIRKEAKSQQPAIVDIAKVVSLSPFSVLYKEVVFSSATDTIFINDLLLDDNINIPLAPLVDPQNFDIKTPSISFMTAIMTGSIPDFIKEFYNYFKSWHKRYILKVGDFVAIQKIGSNKIIVLQKVSKL